MADSARVKEIFVAALDQPEALRGAYLDGACGNDAALRREVEALLAAHFGQPIISTPAMPNGTTETAPLTEGPGTRIGPFKLLQQIGEGGFGVVFMADQETPVRRRVALKIIKLGMDTRRVVARFEAERQALAIMDHPNIARVLDAGATDSGRPYFVMELVKGDPVTEYCDRNNLSIPERLELFTQICNAVQHAHTKGVIHRDIKPTNVLVHTQDGRPHAKVIDFGIAKATDHRLTEKTLFTEHKALIGTPAYMSPEQAEGSLDIDTRTDVYSLGVLMYELLTGTTPFDNRQLREAAYAEMQRIIRETEPQKPSTRLSSMPLDSEPRPSGSGHLANDRAPTHQPSPLPYGRGSDPARPMRTLSELAKHRSTEPKKLGLLVRGELDWIVMKALDKDRARRYETANAFAADVQRHLSGEPVVAAPPSAAYRVRKFVKRHRGQVIAGGVIVATLLVATIGMSITSGIAIRAWRHAETARVQADKDRDAAETAVYATDLNAAQLAISYDDYPEARRRLEKCAAAKRGWEWQFLKQQAGKYQFVLRSVKSAVFNHDGTCVLTASDDGTARLFDAATGKQLGEVMKHDNSVSLALFSHDGRWILTTSTKGMDSTVRLWDAATGRQIGEAMKDSLVNSAEFNHDGTRVLTASFDAVRLWDLSGKQVGEINGASSAVFSTDGKLVLTASGEGVFRLWNISCEEVGEWRCKHKGNTWGHLFAAFSRDGTRVLTAGYDRGVRIWDLAGMQIGKTMMHNVPVSSAVFSPDGTRVLTASYSDMTRMWDASKGKQVGETMNTAYAAVFSHDGTRVLTASTDNTARLWDLGGRCRAVIDLPRYDDSFDGVANCSFGDDGRLAAIADGSSWAVIVPIARFDSPEQRIREEVEAEELNDLSRWRAAVRGCESISCG